MTTGNFTFPYPKIGIGKSKNQLVTMNNSSVWLRYYKTKIKKDLKETLSEWVLPESTLGSKSGEVIFKLYRPTKQRLDADSVAFVAKWIIDLLVERGYYEDDNQLRVVYEPVTVDKDRVETDIKVTFKMN